MNSIWFLIIVFFTPSGDSYMERDMLPREAPSEIACLAKAEQVRKVHAEVQASNPELMNDAEVFCWEARDISHLQERLTKEYSK